RREVQKILRPSVALKRHKCVSGPRLGDADRLPSVGQCHRASASRDQALRPLVADSVEKLFSRTCARNSRPMEASRIFRRGGPRNSVLRATAAHLTSASTMRRANCEMHCAFARNWGLLQNGFFQQNRPIWVITAGAGFALTVERVAASR